MNSVATDHNGFLLGDVATESVKSGIYSCTWVVVQRKLLKTIIFCCVDVYQLSVLFGHRTHAARMKCCPQYIVQIVVLGDVCCRCVGYLAVRLKQNSRFCLVT